MTTFQPWNYPDDIGVGSAADLVGYKVQATDGIIGTVDDAGAEDLVVDSGRWVFHRKVMLPAGIVDRVDTDEQRIYLDRPKHQIRDAPNYEAEGENAGFRDSLGKYYADAHRG